MAEKIPRLEGTACAKALKLPEKEPELCGLNPQAGGERPQSGKDSGLYPLSYGNPLEVLCRGVTRPHVCLKVTQTTAWRMDWSWGKHGIKETGWDYTLREH